MSVVKVIELVGQSDVSWDDAIKRAIKVAGKTVRNIAGVEVSNWTATVEEDEIVSYKANIQVAFIVEN